MYYGVRKGWNSFLCMCISSWFSIICWKVCFTPTELSLLIFELNETCIPWLNPTWWYIIFHMLLVGLSLLVFCWGFLCVFIRDSGLSLSWENFVWFWHLRNTGVNRMDREGLLLFYFLKEWEVFWLLTQSFYLL